MSVVDTLLRRMRALDQLGDEEEKVIRGLVAEERRHPADKTIIRAGEELDHSTLLLEGLVCRYKDLRDGGRQISAIHVPGDFVDLHSFTLKRLDHNIMTISATAVALVPHDRLKRVTEQFPHLTRMFWFLTNADAARHREWELSLGRRDAIAATAHLLCELHARLEVVGLADAGGYPLPLTQTELAECLGLTAIHVNRTLRELREQGLVEFRRARVKVLDRNGLEGVAEFKPAYLYLGHQSQ